MSQTVTKRIQTAASPENIQQAFALMGLPVERNAYLRLFHGSQAVAIKIPSAVLEQIGFPPTVYSDGVGINFHEGNLVLIYDHYNKATVDGLAQYVEALNAIGSQSEQLRGFLAQGFTFEPVFDLKKQEIGIRAVPPSSTDVSNIWRTDQGAEVGGGIW